MSAGSPAAVAGTGGTSVRSAVAAGVVVLALAALAGYTLFSGPTKVPAPSSGASRAAPVKTAPASEQESPGGEGDSGR
jgi:hypothetical protein